MKDSPLVVPKARNLEELLAWASANPDTIVAIIELGNLFLALQTTLTQPVTTRDERNSIIATPDRLMLQIPIVSPNAYGAVSGTLSRAAFDTGTINHATLAQVVGAMITDDQTIGVKKT